MTACPCVGATLLVDACWHVDYVSCIRCGQVMRLAVWTPQGHVCPEHTGADG